MGRAAARPRSPAATAGPLRSAGALSVLLAALGRCPVAGALSASAAARPLRAPEEASLALHAVPAGAPARAHVPLARASTSRLAASGGGAAAAKATRVEKAAGAAARRRSDLVVEQAVAAPGVGAALAQAAVALWTSASSAIGQSLGAASAGATVAGAAEAAADHVADWFKILLGVVFIVIAAPIQWFNEERSARIDALLSSGLEDAVRADAAAADAALRGRLVHVQGWARAAAAVRDIQFREAVIAKCLKLQSTVEVFQWVERVRGGRQGFDMEWTTSHHDNLQPKPSPQNPKPPSKLALGTFTQSCPRVEIGAYVLSDEMVNYFQRFEPAMHLLPERIPCAGMTFFANREDGYYYGRPGLHSPFGVDRDKLLSHHMAGDIRARFMYVPETDATVVAVQCHKDGAETFVPYRPVVHRPCAQDYQARRLRIEEGERSTRTSNRDAITCCAAGGLKGCCCCACNAIACVCESEVVTEEICYVSDRLEPLEQPFQWAVHRSPWRVWNFRVLGLLAMFVGVKLILNPFGPEIAQMRILAVYGSAAALVVAVTSTAACLFLITAAATAVYRPGAAMRWVLVAAFVAAAPFVLGSQYAAGIESAAAPAAGLAGR